MVGRSTLTYKIHRGDTCLGHLDGTDHRDFQNKSICHPTPDGNAYLVFGHESIHPSMHLLSCTMHATHAS